MLAQLGDETVYYMNLYFDKDTGTARFEEGNGAIKIKDLEPKYQAKEVMDVFAELEMYGQLGYRITEEGIKEYLINQGNANPSADDIAKIKGNGKQCLHVLQDKFMRDKVAGENITMEQASSKVTENIQRFWKDAEIKFYDQELKLALGPAYSRAPKKS